MPFACRRQRIWIKAATRLGARDSGTNLPRRGFGVEFHNKPGVPIRFGVTGGCLRHTHFVTIRQSLSAQGNFRLCLSLGNAGTIIVGTDFGVLIVIAHGAERTGRGSLMESSSDVSVVHRDLQAAAGAIDITPEHSLPLAGWKERTAPFLSVVERLQANALLLDDGHTRIVAVSADLLYWGQELRDRLLARLGLEPATLLLAASHTHYSPMTQQGMPLLGLVDDRYVELVAERVGALIESLADRLRPVSVEYSEGQADHSIHRRRPRSRPWNRSRTIMGPNPGGPRDETIRVVQFRDRAGGRLAVVWNYACHPTGYPEPRHVTSEFPGVVRRNLQNRLGSEIPVLFFQGFSGDLRPPFRARMRSLRDVVNWGRFGIIFGPPTQSEWSNWADSLAELVIATLAGNTEPIQATSLAASYHLVPLGECLDGTDSDPRFALQCISIGDRLQWVAMSAEPVVAYRCMVEKLFPGKKVITIGDIDRVFGYLPTDSMLADGGYEVDGFRRAFSFPGRFRGGIDQLVARHLSASAAETLKPDAATSPRGPGANRTPDDRDRSSPRQNLYASE